MASIELKNVSKIFDVNKVVDNVSITVSDGEFLALVGPSGCGKSTLLRMISGLESIDEGSIIIDGQEINKVPPKNRDIAMVFQNYALYPHMSVYDNLAFGLKMRDVKKEQIDTLVHEAADLLDISDLLKRKPKQLSGGQKQRIAVGRAIVRNPKAFLFDEPLSNLDAKLRVKMRTDLLKLHKKQNATSIYVTHDQVEAMTMADRIAIINKGVVQQIDTPLQVYTNPKNLFVASFIGSPSMNFLKGTIKIENSSSIFTSQSGLTTFKIPCHFLETIPEKNYRDIILGIRPEDLVFKSIDENTISIKSTSVELIEHMGDVSMVHIELEPDLEWVVKTEPTNILKAGHQAPLYINIKKAHFFNSKTEESLL